MVYHSIALVVTPGTRFALNGENSEFTCNLYGGNVDTSFIRQCSITLQNEATIEISGNNSDFILLPPHNSRLVIVRHDMNIFNEATISCFGALNFTATAELSVVCKYHDHITAQYYSYHHN